MGRGKDYPIFIEIEFGMDNWFWVWQISSSYKFLSDIQIKLLIDKNLVCINSEKLCSFKHNMVWLMYCLLLLEICIWNIIRKLNCTIILISSNIYTYDITTLVKFYKTAYILLLKCLKTQYIDDRKFVWPITLNTHSWSK